MQNLNTNWLKTLDLYKKQYEDKLLFDIYFSSLKIREIIDEEIVVTVDNVWSYEIVFSEVKKLEYIYNDITSGHYHIKLMVEDDYKAMKENDEYLKIVDHLNENFTFHNFVVGNCNRTAQNASLVVAMESNVSYNPLFIYGNHGLGKTHLLSAIGNYIKKKFPNMKVLYITCQDFINDYITHLIGTEIYKFKQKYNSIDVMLIDDIQYLAGREASQKEFFQIVNKMITNGKQVVISSDKKYNDIPKLEKCIVSQLSSGLCVQIGKLDTETAFSILNNYLDIEDYEIGKIDKEVLNYIVTYYGEDARLIIGAARKLMFYSLMNNVSYFDMEVLKDAQMIFPVNQANENTLELFIKKLTELRNEFKDKKDVIEVIDMALQHAAYKQKLKE